MSPGLRIGDPAWKARRRVRAAKIQKCSLPILVKLRTQGSSVASRFLPIAATVLGLSLISTGSAVAAACPNEELRAESHSSGLPDCRAYELVTPSFKFGEPPGRALVEPAGEGHAVYEPRGFGEAGDDSTVKGGEYVGTGW